MTENGRVTSANDRVQFHAARIDHTVLKTDPTGAILATARQLVAQRGDVGDLILIHGPPSSARLFGKVMQALEDEAKS